MINVAIVGTGNIANAHVTGLLTFPERCKIVALCDIYPEKAKAMKEKYALDCEVFADHQKMLDSQVKIDLVHVCTPPYVHCEIAVNSMNAGCNVVVEKPMATGATISAISPPTPTPTVPTLPTNWPITATSTIE